MLKKVMRSYLGFDYEQFGLALTAEINKVCVGDAFLGPLLPNPAFTIKINTPFTEYRFDLGNHASLEFLLSIKLI
jgi:hypothetical protein